jgi:hypothetical protein
VVTPHTGPLLVCTSVPAEHGGGDDPSGRAARL